MADQDKRVQRPPLQRRLVISPELYNHLLRTGSAKTAGLRKRAGVKP